VQGTAVLVLALLNIRVW